MQNNNFRRAMVLYNNEQAGVIEEIETGYRFTYSDEFIEKKKSISISLPVENKLFESADLFPFFVGLLPEGWYLDIVSATLKIDKNNQFGILIATCEDTIGAVSIYELKKD